MGARWDSSRWALLTLQLGSARPDIGQLLDSSDVVVVLGNFVAPMSWIGLVCVPAWYTPDVILFLLRLKGVLVEGVGLAPLRSQTAMALAAFGAAAVTMPPLLRWVADRLDAAARVLLPLPPGAVPPPTVPPAPSPEPNNDGPDPVA